MKPWLPWLPAGMLGLGILTACDRDASRRESELATEKERRDHLRAQVDRIKAEIALLKSDSRVDPPPPPPRGRRPPAGRHPGSQPLPDARWILEPSLHDGTLVRLTVRKAGEGAIADRVDTHESDAMKWVVGWVDDTSYVFWGADMGTRWVRAFDGNAWSERPISNADCAALERLFEAKYGERRGNCLRPE